MTDRGRDLGEVRAYVAELTNLAAEARRAAVAKAETTQSRSVIALCPMAVEPGPGPPVTVKRS